MRPLYVRYRALGDMSPEVEDPTDAPAGEDDEAEFITPETSLEELKARKATLQKFLCHYENAFATQYRRPVEYLQDREPVQKEYREYRALKRRIRALADQ